MGIGQLLFSFSGRINRAKFWLGYLSATVLVGAILGAAIYLVPWDQVTTVDASGQAVRDELGNPVMDWGKIGPLPMALYAFGMLLALWTGFAVMVKRCHDRGYSGWMSLISLIPLAGFIWVIVALGVMEGTKGPNPYGPDPLAGIT